jgi:hypothetical protein
MTTKETRKIRHIEKKKTPRQDIIPGRGGGGADPHRDTANIIGCMAIFSQNEAKFVRAPYKKKNSYANFK